MLRASQALSFPTPGGQRRLQDSAWLIRCSCPSHHAGGTILSAEDPRTQRRWLWASRWPLGQGLGGDQTTCGSCPALLAASQCTPQSVMLSKHTKAVLQQPWASTLQPPLRPSASLHFYYKLLIIIKIFILIEIEESADVGFLAQSLSGNFLRLWRKGGFQ